MATISIFRQKLKKVTNKRLIDSLVFQQIEKYKGILIDLVLLQLEKGENPQGEVVGYYTRQTELNSLLGTAKPVKPKKEGDPYNFEWTGGFFDGMFLKVGKTQATFGSSEKQKLLEEQYGNLIGLQIENFIKAKEEYLLPGLITDLRKIIDV